jgi:hypothetical protein
MATVSSLLSSVDAALKTYRMFQVDNSDFYSKLSQAAMRLANKIWENPDATRIFASMDYMPTFIAMLSKVNCNTKHIKPEDSDVQVLQQAHIASSVAKIAYMLSSTDLHGYTNRSVDLIPALLLTQKNYPNYGPISPTAFYGEQSRFSLVRSVLHELSIHIWRAVASAAKSSMKNTNQYVDILTQPQHLVACYKTFATLSAIEPVYLPTPKAMQDILASLSSIVHMAGKNNASHLKDAVRNPEFDMTVLINYMETTGYKEEILAFGCSRTCNFITKYTGYTNAHLLRAILKCIRQYTLTNEITKCIYQVCWDTIQCSMSTIPFADFKKIVLQYGMIELIVRTIDLVTDKINNNDGDINSIVRSSISILIAISTSSTMRQEMDRHNVRFYMNRMQSISTNPKYKEWFTYWNSRQQHYKK